MSTKRGRALDNLDGDIRDHIEREIHENIERGMSPEDARSAALRSFGNILRVEEDTRDVWNPVWAGHLLQDVRFGLRMLARNAGFTAVVIATLALGIGLNTTVFSVVNAVLLRPIPYPHADRLVWIGNYSAYSRRDIFESRPHFRMWRQQARSFESMTGYGNQDLALVYEGQASQERIASFAGDFWSMSAARPAFGRLFGGDEANSLVLTWPLFERRFRADPAAIGKTVLVNGYPVTILGVLAKDFRFRFPQQYIPGDEVRDLDAFLPIPDSLLQLPATYPYLLWEEATRRLGPSPWALNVIGRLKPGVAPEQARAEMETLYARAHRGDPPALPGDNSLHFTGLQDKVVGGSRRALLVLLAAVVFVLWIACANIANLLVARAAVRQREIAIRAAVGAGQMRVVRQFLAESMLLALGGGAAGLALAGWGLAILKRIGSQAVPRLAETAMDARVLWFTLLVSVTTGVVFGLAPAISVWRTGLHDLLKREAAGVARLRLRQALVAAELAIAIVLLAGAGLMLKSAWRMNARPPGFTPEKILVMRVTLSGPQYAAWPPKQAYTEELLRRLESTPGVEAAGLNAGALATTVQVQGESKVSASIRAASPGFLRAMGVPLVSGQWPAEGNLFAVVVNESFAHQMGGRNLTGRHIGGSILNDTISGVVADFKSSQLDAGATPDVYMPYERFPYSRTMRVVVRTAQDSAALAPVIRKLVSAVDPSQPVYEFQTLEQELADSIAPRRFNLFLLAGFAATALLLALIGIYGVIAYSVTQRTHEIGVRMALGARRGEIVGMVVRQGMALAAAGILGGLVAASGLTRMMASLLYEVKPDDPWILGAVAVILAATAFLACMGPALRAARVDPLIALRYE